MRRTRWLPRARSRPADCPRRSTTSTTPVGSPRPVLAAHTPCPERVCAADVFPPAPLPQVRVEQGELARVGGDETQLVVREWPAGGGVAQLDEPERQILVRHLKAERTGDVPKARHAAVFAGEHDPSRPGMVV